MVRTIDGTIKKGIGVGIIQDALQTNRERIHRATKEMLKNLIADEQILEIMSTEENIKKIQNRIETRISIKGRVGEELLTASRFNQIPERAINEIKRNITEGDEVREGYSGSVADKLYQEGWKGGRTLNAGYVKRVETKIILRKG